MHRKVRNILSLLIIADCPCRGCGNVQCYICSEICTGPNGYAHFNDTRRGGNSRNCPLFDQGGSEARHDEDVEKAQQEARKLFHTDLANKVSCLLWPQTGDKVLAENPEFAKEDLDIKVSEKVLLDDAQRKEASLRRQAGLPEIHQVAIPEMYPLRKLQLKV
jgi:E3 ubiquitin-protein ligase RNF216